MRRPWIASSFLLGLGVSVLLASLNVYGQIPIPPGVRAADKAQERANQTIEPPQQPVQPKLNSAEVLQQADELRTLAQQVYVDTKQATQGLLAKDLKDKLKRIEKLSKHLREELTP